MGAGFPPDTMQTSVKFWAWYRLKGAGESAATTSMEVGGASKGRAEDHDSVGGHRKNSTRHYTRGGAWCGIGVLAGDSEQSLASWNF